MPVVFRYKGYRFFFYSNEGTPREPLHIHVREGERIAKFWLEPEILLADNLGFAAHQLAEIWDVILQNQLLMKEKWREYTSN